MKLMRYLPFERYLLQTNLTREEVLDRLAMHVEPKKTFRLPLLNSGSTKAYEGNITELEFSINRIINYRNSFLPVIKGKINTRQGKTELIIKMKLMSFTHAFIAFFIAVLSLISITSFVKNVSDFINSGYRSFSPLFLIPIAMLAFAYSITTIGFKVESAKSKKFIKTLFEAEEIL